MELVRIWNKNPVLVWKNWSFCFYVTLDVTGLIWVCGKCWFTIKEYGRLAVRAIFCDFLWRDFASSVPSGRILKAGRVLNQTKTMKIINRFFDKKILPFFTITYFCYRIIQPEQPPLFKEKLCYFWHRLYVIPLP